MRTAKQVKAINAQLEVLEELKEQLQSVLIYIDNVMQRGTSWIKEEENASFKEINHFLTNETSECFQRCLNLADGNEEQSQPSCTKEEDKGIPSVCSSISMQGSLPTCFTENQKLTEKINGVEKIVVKQSITLKTLKQKFKEQEKETAEIIMDRNSDLKFKEIMTELQAASNFMTELQTQNELLTNQVNENLKQHNDLVEQKLNSLAKPNVCKHDSTHTKEFDEINKRVSENCDDIKEIKNQSGSMLSSLKNVERRLDDMSLLVDPLKSSCHGHAEKEDLNIKILNVSTRVEELLKRIIKIESTDLALGFEASIEENYILCHEDEILTCFTYVIQDLGNNFDTHTGIYTVPLDGIYMCALFIEIDSFVKNDLVFVLYLKSSESEEAENQEDKEEITIASCCTKFRGQSVCDVIFRKLKLGDQLYIKYISKRQNIKFNTSSHFTCVLLNPCK